MTLVSFMMEDPTVTFKVERKTVTLTFKHKNRKEYQISQPETVKESVFLAAFREQQCLFAVVMREEKIQQKPISAEIQSILKEFSEICSEELLCGLPPLRNIQTLHRICL